MAAKFGVLGSVQVARSGMSNSSTASSTDSSIPYEGNEKLKIWNLDVENDPGWRLKNDTLYHGGLSYFVLSFIIYRVSVKTCD